MSAKTPKAALKAKPAPEPRLFVNATFTSFRRNKRTINPGQALLKIDGVNSKEEAQFYVGKKVAAPQKGKKKTDTPNWGTVTQAHGNSGIVRAKFDRNLPPIFLGSQVRVYLFPSTI
jgi:large subunit ribosomal protein L35Ae